jgi:AcrR family transcriptional regulator
MLSRTCCEPEPRADPPLGTVIDMATFTPPPTDTMRAKLLLAAREEFAAVGITGARIERIAASSSSNKAQIFHYFGSKEGLFDALYAQTLAETLALVPLDAEDLPEYAGRLHDAAVQRPWAQRLVTWYRLERGDAAPLEAVVAGNAQAVAEIERAQRAGVLPRTLRPAVLLGLVVHLAAFWSETSPELDALVTAVMPARRRQVVVDAVAALVGR